MDFPATLFAVNHALPAGQQLTISVDTLVEGVHFSADFTADALGYKSVAVNLSDMAAMGARPLAIQCAWSDPHDDSSWRAALRHAIEQTADAVPMTAEMAMVTAPRRQISIQIIGAVPHGEALTRAGACAGDQLWVSGALGDAGCGLMLSRNPAYATEREDRDYLLHRLHHPTPRLALGAALRGVASAAIDISDGLAGDASHLVTRSKIGIRIFAHCLPLSPALLRVAGESRARQFALGAGEDYELAFTAPARHTATVRQVARDCAVPVHCVGEVVSGNALVLLDEQMRVLPLPSAFDHFSRPAATMSVSDHAADGDNAHKDASR